MARVETVTIEPDGLGFIATYRKFQGSGDTIAQSLVDLAESLEYELDGQDSGEDRNSTFETYTDNSWLEPDSEE